jgi:alpha-tubulin suppressor-like RCC1 family protein
VRGDGTPLTGIVEVGGGYDFTCARDAGGGVWCWGGNEDGQFGDGTQNDHSSPVLLAYLEADSTIACFGWNGHARLGIGTGSGYSGGEHTTREKVLSARGGAPFTGARQVVAGGVTCALMQDTGVYCWGDNHYGQSGTGQGETVPAKVRTADGTPLTGVDRLIAGYTHICAIRAGGEVLCWGRNNDGDLGTGAFGNRGFPERIESVCP